MYECGTRKIEHSFSIVDFSGLISIHFLAAKIYLRGYVLRSMHFLFRDHCINLHNLFSQLHIVWRKLMLGMA